MITWINAEEASRTFFVSEEKLRKYSRRGNLSYRYEAEVRIYNKQQLMNLFPKRGEELSGIKLGSAFSKLGQIKMSENSKRQQAGNKIYAASVSKFMKIA